MPFENPVVGGTALRIPAIQSPNYNPGVAGWIIKINGDAEFNNLVVRGEFIGTNFIINSAGLFMYSGTPAAGNLIVSIAAASGTDSFGNAYVKGEGLYGAAGTLTAKDTAGNTAVISGALPVSGLLAALPGIALQPVTNTGDPATIGALDPGGGGDLGLILTSPSPNTNGVPGTDFAQIYLTGPYSGPAPSITMAASAAGGTINMNGTTLDENGIVSPYGFDAFNTYTPNVANGGTVTWTTRTGWWQRIGKMVFFSAYLVVNNAGSGAGSVQIDAPTSIDRTTRQVITTNCMALTGGTGSCQLVAFTGGSGATFDRLLSSTGAIIQGANLAAGAVIVATGFYREA